MERLREFCNELEDHATQYFQPLRPHLAAIGGFLIVADFIDDGSRILMQWNDQVWFLNKYPLSSDLLCCD